MTPPFAQPVMLDHHLRFNHFPPIIDGGRFALAAIAAVQDGRGDQPVDDPQSGRHAPTAWAVVETWHLDWFLAGDEGDDQC